MTSIPTIYNFARLLFLLILFIPHFVIANNLQTASDNQARLRFFGQAVIDLEFYNNSACYGGENGTVASSSGFEGAFGSKENITIGIPITPNVENLKNRDGILARAFYREYTVSANKPLSIVANYYATTGVSSYSCKNMAVAFVPEKGKDYEVSLDFIEDKGSDYCLLNITKIDVINSKVALTPVDIKKANKCESKISSGLSGAIISETAVDIGRNLMKELNPKAFIDKLLEDNDPTMK